MPQRLQSTRSHASPSGAVAHVRNVRFHSGRGSDAGLEEKVRTSEMHFYLGLTLNLSIASLLEQLYLLFDTQLHSELET